MRDIVSSARLHIKAQACKCFIIAIRYLHETRYRYLVATHLGWRTLDIVKAYTLRWFVEDLKVHAPRIISSRETQTVFVYPW